MGSDVGNLSVVSKFCACSEGLKWEHPRIEGEFKYHVYHQIL